MCAQSLAVPWRTHATTVPDAMTGSAVQMQGKPRSPMLLHGWGVFCLKLLPHHSPVRAAEGGPRPEGP